jgi:hypothetical protein
VKLAIPILLCLIVGGLLTGWVLGRLGIAWSWLISFCAHLLARLTVALVFAAMAVEAVGLGGAWYALAAAFTVLALAALGLVGLSVWGVVRHDIPEELPWRRR